ncbi:hypothetical protein [Ferruginibacter profundus]
MNKSILVLAFFFFSTFCFAQKEEIESVMNVAYKEIVPAGFEYFNLIDSSIDHTFPFCISLPDTLDDKAFFINNPGFRISEFLQIQFPGRLNWKDYAIEKSRIFDYKSIPKFESQIRINHLVPFNTPKEKVALMEENRAFNEIILPVKKHWGRKKTAKKLVAKREAYAGKIRPEDKNYFSFSAPVFSKDQQFAIVRLNASGYGFSCIFKKTGYVWAKVYLYNRWVS